MGPSYTNTGPARGPLVDRDVPGTIGVLQAPDNPMPIGMALCIGWHPSDAVL
jgi:hypothetical protein